MDDYFFDIWCNSYKEDEAVWVQSFAPLDELIRLSSKGLIVSGTVNNQKDFVWKLTELGCLVGSAMHKHPIISFMMVATVFGCIENVTRSIFGKS